MQRVLDEARRLGRHVPEPLQRRDHRTHDAVRGAGHVGVVVHHPHLVDEGRCDIPPAAPVLRQHHHAARAERVGHAVRVGDRALAVEHEEDLRGRAQLGRVPPALRARPGADRGTIIALPQRAGEVLGLAHVNQRAAGPAGAFGREQLGGEVAERRVHKRRAVRDVNVDVLRAHLISVEGARAPPLGLAPGEPCLLGVLLGGVVSHACCLAQHGRDVRRRLCRGHPGGAEAGRSAPRRRVLGEPRLLGCVLGRRHHGTVDTPEGTLANWRRIDEIGRGRDEEREHLPKTEGGEGAVVRG
eukprot:scaffold31947_cov63-Phaeocystis_antarctica.AAC.8